MIFIMAQPLYKIERAKVAELRFISFTIQTESGRPTAYPFGVMDAEADPKTIAKFKNFTDAKLFIDARKTRYVKDGT